MGTAVDAGTAAVRRRRAAWRRVTARGTRSGGLLVDELTVPDTLAPYSQDRLVADMVERIVGPGETGHQRPARGAADHPEQYG